MTNDPSDLLGIATTVSDGAAVDWIKAGAHSEGVDQALLQELQVIARIAEAQRVVWRDEALTKEWIGGRSWGHLVLKEKLGAGAFGAVYRAWDPGLERDVALKVYNARRDSLDSGVTSLLSEGRLLARVRHPNVVVVHGVEERGEEVGLWLELIDGRTLADEVRSNGLFGFREAALIGQDLCRALAAVHQAGLVHRDVKPQNVMRERGGRIVLMDFSIGREVSASGPGTLDVGGTPLYMAPELFGGASATTASDIYSLGVLLFCLVTGTYPVSAANRLELQQSHRDGRRKLLRDVRPDLPESFVQVIERASAREPSQRFDTAGSMEVALGGVLGVPGPAATTSSATILAPADPRPQSRVAFWAIAASLLVLLGIAGAWWSITQGTPDAPPAEPASALKTVAPPLPPDGSYSIHASFHRADAAGSVTLEPGAKVQPGDRLFLELRSSKPLHVYVVNQDERGETYLLFPLPGQQTTNPLPSGTHRLPGPRGGEEVYWQVTSAGGREHFLVVASPDRVAPLEQVFEKLPKPVRGRPVSTAAYLSRDVVGRLRGIGGLAPRPDRSGPETDLIRSATALARDAETLTGPWMRQFTLQNPGR